MHCWKSREKNHESLDCDPEKLKMQAIDEVIFWCTRNVRKVEKLFIVLASTVGAGSLISIVFAVVNEYSRP